MVLNPDTGYFPFDNCNVFCFIFELGCFGMTNAVCFNSDRSLHNADINGKSKCLLRSRNTLISIGVAGAVIVLVDVELLTTLAGSFVTNFIDALVRGKVVVTGSPPRRGLCITSKNLQKMRKKIFDFVSTMEIFHSKSN